MKKITSSLVLLIVLSLVACGGGGSSSGSGSGGITQTLPITITTDPFLPVTLNGQPYSTTLAASNGKGALKWSIRPISPTTLFVDGLTIDSATGVLSGKTTFLGTAGFVATVTDANSQTASKNFNLTAYGPLTQPSPLNLTTEIFCELWFAAAWNFHRQHGSFEGQRHEVWNVLGDDNGAGFVDNATVLRAGGEH